MTRITTQISLGRFYSTGIKYAFPSFVFSLYDYLNNLKEYWILKTRVPEQTMALNPDLHMPPAMAYSQPSVRNIPAPVPYMGEYIFASRDTCHVSISGEEPFSFSGFGKVYLTNYRLVFVPHKPNMTFRGIELPLLYIEDFDVHQPIFGANYMAGRCRRVDEPDRAMLKWKLKFSSGGMGTMVPLFYATVQYIRTAVQNLNSVSTNEDEEHDDTVKPPPFVANAVVDPNDPTVVYIVEQPVQPPTEPIKPKFPTAKKND